MTALANRLAAAAKSCPDLCPASPTIVGIANALRMTRNQTVYVLSTPDGFYKIGITTGAVRKRIARLQTGCPQKISEEDSTAIDNDEGVNAVEMERGMHALLAPYNSHGEWFKTTPETVGRAWKQTWVRLASPELYARWQRFVSKKEAILN